MKKVIYLLFGSLVGLASCKGRMECQNPPPILYMLLKNADGTSAADTSKAKQATVQYYKNGQLTRVNDLRTNFGIQSYDMIGISRQTNDTTRFYVSAADKPFGTVQLKTYVDNSRCDGWTHVSEFRYNGAVIPYDNMKPGYTLVIP